MRNMVETFQFLFRTDNFNDDVIYEYNVFDTYYTVRSCAALWCN
jgi:hypothetical protein